MTTINYGMGQPEDRERWCQVGPGLWRVVRYSGTFSDLKRTLSWSDALDVFLGLCYLCPGNFVHCRARSHRSTNLSGLVLLDTFINVEHFLTAGNNCGHHGTLA